MSCKLYYKHGPSDYYLGEFQNKAKAEAHWSLIKTMLEDKLGTGLTPIYVETGKKKLENELP